MLLSTITPTHKYFIPIYNQYSYNPISIGIFTTIESACQKLAEHIFNCKSYDVGFDSNNEQELCPNYVKLKNDYRLSHPYIKFNKKQFISDIISLSTSLLKLEHFCNLYCYGYKNDWDFSIDIHYSIL